MGDDLTFTARPSDAPAPMTFTARPLTFTARKASGPLLENKPGVEYGQVLPISRDVKTGEMSMALPEILRAPIRGWTRPIDQFDQNNPQHVADLQAAISLFPGAVKTMGRPAVLPPLVEAERVGNVPPQFARPGQPAPAAPEALTFTPRGVPAVRPTEPAPPAPPATPTAEAARPVLAAPAPTAPAPVETPPAPTPTGPPPAADIVKFKPGELTLKPDLMQYKASDAKGVTGRLSASTVFEPNLASPIVVWQNKEGENVVVNGHQRTDLAKRADAAGQEGIELHAKVFKEADGYPADYVKALGAYQNITEGSGTPMDAAKVLRSAKDFGPDLKLPQLPPNEPMVQKGRALASLGDDAWSMVMSGAVPPEQGILVGNMVKDPAQQTAVMKVLQKSESLTDQQTKLLIDDIQGSGFLQAGTGDEGQGNLFGAGSAAKAVPLFVPRARVLDNTLRSLRAQKNVFRAAVTGEEALTEAGNKLATEGNIKARAENELLIARIEAEATKRGGMSDLLTQAAKDLAGGKSMASVTKAFVTAAKKLPANAEAAPPAPKPVNALADLSARTEGQWDHDGAVDLSEPPQPTGANLFGEMPDEKAAPTAPEPTIANDPNQITMPGMEPSAVQAQAARDQTGRGGLTGKTEQAKPDEGLFAKPAAKPEKDMFSSATMPEETSATAAAIKGTTDEEFLKLLEAAQANIARKTSLAEKWASEGASLKFHKSGTSRSVLVSPDLETVGKWRITYFDEDGPSGHVEFPTAKAAFREALDQGFNDPKPINALKNMVK